jgi:S1-C subfamily serine protease
MDVLDLVLIVVCLGFAMTGYRQGFVVGVLSFVGFIGGGVLGARLAGTLHARLHVGMNPALFGLLVVLAGAIVGQLLATVAGVSLRREMTWRPLRALDSIGGGLISVVSVLLVAWLVGSALANSASPDMSAQVRDSKVLQGVDEVMPASVGTWFGSFRRLLDQDLDRYGFPQVFGSIAPTAIAPVSPPNPALARSPAVEHAGASVVKVTGLAASCSREIEGSGFVYAPRRVMTNAHVVAGVASPTVQTATGTTLPARVVVYDPDRDVAVLDVPGLTARPLQFGGPLARGRNAIVLGYPENGPFTAVPARVRSAQRAAGPDIYQDRQVTRNIYSLYAMVRPGNSGGPLLTARGRVAGVVFAAAIDNARTGYALTSGEVSGDAARGATATGSVSTGDCD